MEYVTPNLNPRWRLHSIMSDTELPDLKQLWTRLTETLLADRQRLRRSLHALEARAKRQQPYDRSLQKWLADCEQSQQRVAERRALIPAITYDETLPVSARREELLAAIRTHQVLVVCGETGSGKSTQLPKLCLEAGQGGCGVIGHTQPRRIAARSVATRIAEELGQPLGQSVGFKIRFTDKTSQRTAIKLMTDGILLAESQSDRDLEQYDTLIIDEAHERSLNIDFLLGYIKQILPKRPDLKVIITSATIDAERFAQFFSTPAVPTPIMEVSGRMYPVEIRYRPPLDEEGESSDIDWHRTAADACEELAFEGTGDILVFMPTERDIRETAKLLQGRSFAGDYHNRKTEIVPLFGRLSEQEQNRVFAPHEHRRIVIATNVAESSLTVPGIISVVDPGTARISRFSATSQVQRLPIEPISQASANQRAGRCGRVAPGVCVRLYSEGDFLSREEYTQPEILRTNLANVVLQMKSLKLGRIEDFPFLDPPTPTAIRAGLKSLFELGAIDEEEQLTPIGEAMSRLPVDPRIARMILAAEDEQCLEEVLIMTSALELRDPRERPLDRQQAADEAHAKLNDETSDFLSYLKLWDFYSSLEKKLSRSQLRKACLQNYLSYNRLREWKDLHRQLRQMVTERGMKPTPRRNQPEAIHRAILTGLLHHVALKGETHEYTGAGGQKLFLWPGSVAFSGKPKWIMAAELVETTKRYARCVAPIQPEWIERIAGHVIKRQYSEPHWHEKSACVMAWERVLLYGLPIVARRRTRYGHIDPAFCRELFIQRGLIEGGYQSRGAFAQHNAELKAELKNWLAKVRQGQHLSGEEAEYHFYDARIPAEVTDGPRFEKWRQQVEQTQPRILFLRREDLIEDTSAVPEQNAFPDRLKIGTMDVPVEYQLEPGTEQDGVTLTIPPEGLNQLSSENLSWLVPGLLVEKITALLKTLPKQLRILFVPAPEIAAQVAPHLKYGQGDLLTQLSLQLRQISGERIPIDAFDLTRMPPHLLFNVKIVDARGAVLAQGRDLAELKRKVQQLTSATVRSAASGAGEGKWQQTGLTTWSFGELPARLELQRGGMTVVAFPMLVDAGDSVSLRLAESPIDAQFQTRRGLSRLYALLDRKRLDDQVRHWPNWNQLLLQLSGRPDASRFREDLTFALAQGALWKSPEIPRTPAEWDAKCASARNQLSVVVQELVSILEPLLTGYHTVRRTLERNRLPAFAPLQGELQQQLDGLLLPGFLTHVPLGWLSQYPRYFKAMLHRWEKATTGGFQKDRQHQQKVVRHSQRWQQASGQLGELACLHPQLTHYRFLVEEFRVSLFAQQLGTALPVSEKRLDEVWATVVNKKYG